MTQEKERGAPPNRSEGAQSEAWNKFVAFVMTEKKILASYLKQVWPLDLPPGRLRVGVEDRHHLSYLQDPENLALLKDLARRFFSEEVTVAVAPLAAKKQDHKDDNAGVVGPAKGETGDMVNEALRIFGGSIKEIKR